MKGVQGDHHQDLANITSSSTSAAERGGRSVSRERTVTKSSAASSGATHTNTTSSAAAGNAQGASRGKLNGLDLLDEEVDNGPAISSADLDQLMEDFDLNDPLEEEPPAKPMETTSAAAKEEENKEEKPHGLAGALPGGLGAGLSGIPNPMGEGNLMGKLGDLAAQNPVTDVMSKGKDFLFKKFGL